MDRRRLLTLICRVASGACAAVVAVPGVAYLVAPLRKRGKSPSLVRRLCRLDDLTPGTPSEYVFTGNRQDAWTLYPSEVLGRVWLVRRAETGVPFANASVDAFSAICPHLGCTIGLDTGDLDTGDLDTGGAAFFCPCHNALFQFSGEAVRTADDGEKNPSPRNMDTLDCRIVQDEKTEEWWVEVKYQEFEIGSEKKTPRA